MPSSLHNLFTNARKLVPFLPPKPISPHTAKDQQNALLVARLPTELRQMIWDTYFHGHAVHIYAQREKLHARECLEWGMDDASLGPHSGSCGRKKIRCDHISLLLTCKKMYISCPPCSRPSTNYGTSYFECIYTLYRVTSFDFSQGARSLAITPERLPVNISLIRKVNLKWEHYDLLWLKERKLGKREKLWIGVWKALATMEGLEWLRVELTITRPWEGPLWTEKEWTLLEGVKAVTRPSHFELILPFPAADSTREETLPCTITRRLVEFRLVGQ